MMMIQQAESGLGKCKKEDKCPYIHDPDKVAVCTRFLRGTCEKTDGSCPFSHDPNRDKALHYFTFRLLFLVS
eukprot:m.99433 g.99433  ORF g.99433 m.99433 type:complete len:72 (+) comp37067_c0_seq16:1637-1852(+)